MGAKEKKAVRTTAKELVEKRKKKQRIAAEQTEERIMNNVYRQYMLATHFKIPANIDMKGFQERIFTGVEWTLVEEAAMCHRNKHMKEFSRVGFTLAFQKKIANSLIGKFLDTTNKMTMEELWCYMIPLQLYDNEHGTDEKRTCFLEQNCITDNCLKMIKKAVLANDRQVLWSEFKKATVLRCLFAKVTELDTGILAYRHLKTLNLSGNYLRTIDSSCLPPTLCALELQSNFIQNLDFIANLPQCLMYLGLSRNLIDDEVVETLSILQSSVIVLDLSDNDIYFLERVLDPLSLLNLDGLLLAGNPCAYCMAYAKTTLLRLTSLKYLDSREVLVIDRPIEKYPPGEMELKTTYFTFSVIRILNAPQPLRTPNIPRDAVLTYHIELEIPLLDSVRRRFLMYRNNTSLTEIPPVDDDEYPDDDNSKKSITVSDVDVFLNKDDENGERPPCIFDNLERVTEVIRHYTIFETNKVSWNKIMSFSDPVVRIFCPDLKALRDTFRSVITLKLVFRTHVMRMKPSKGRLVMKPVEMRLVVATIKCNLKRVDWTQRQQHFHWSENLNTADAIHWGNGDLTALTYVASPNSKSSKQDPNAMKANPLPDCLTCHLGFGIESTHR